MLTSTYTLVALSVEQARARIEVQALLERWRPCAWWGEPPSMRQYEQACDALRQVCEACHWRKLDKFVLPALRRRGEDATRLVAELDGLGRQALEARQAAQAAAVDGDPGCLAALERCCELLLERLEREERELLPLARTMIPGETWFAIANLMLAHDAHQSESRGETRGDSRGADLGGMRGLPPSEISSRQNHALPMVN
jgi:hypothetical protein